MNLLRVGSFIANTTYMLRNTPDESFELEAAAREHAATISQKERLRWNIVLTGDLFFVTTSNKIQPYEKLVASYVNGIIL